jgi:tetratricopeptide (TPR) repeat protein
LAVADIPEALRTSILEKSDGNPFFIEEVVRALVDNGVVVPEERIVDGSEVGYWVATGDGSDFSIPDNLQSLLAARMDRLEEATRATLQLASVIGRSFYLRVLQAVDESSPELDKHVGTLLRLDMIRESARVPEVEYSFRNPLTQEAVYKTILLKRRREFHRRVGQAMEELYSDHQEGLHGLLAHHYTLASEQEKAIKHSRLASQQAVAVYAYEEAAQNLRAALNLIDPEDRTAIHMALLEELGDVCSLLRDFTQAVIHFQRALAIWEFLPEADSIIAIRLNRKIVDIANDTKWSVDAETYQEISDISQESKINLQESLTALEDELPHSETVHLLVALSTEAWRVQTPPDWESVQGYAQDAVIMAEKLDDAVLLSQSLGVLANALDGRSLLRQHVNVAQRRLEITEAEGFDDIREKIDAQRGIGVALMYVGEYAEALPYLDEATALATRIRATDQIANALGIKAQCLFRMDRWDAVLETEKQWRELEGSYSRERIGETCFFVALSASVHALRGDSKTANEYAKESFDYMVSMSGMPDEWQRNQFY